MKKMKKNIDDIFSFALPLLKKEIPYERK